MEAHQLLDNNSLKTKSDREENKKSKRNLGTSTSRDKKCM